MHSVTTPELVKEHREEKKSQTPKDSLAKSQRLLILNILEHGCHVLENERDDMVSQRKSTKDSDSLMMRFFKFPNATYLTKSLFLRLKENLERFLPLISGRKTNANLADQYSFYFTLKILTANF